MLKGISQMISNVGKIDEKFALKAVKGPPRLGPKQNLEWGLSSPRVHKDNKIYSSLTLTWGWYT